MSKDGSDSAFSSTLHLASTCDDGRVNSQIVKAGNRVRGGSAPSNKSYRYVLAFELLESCLEATYHMLATHQTEIVVFVAGDSITSLRALAGTAHDVALMAATGKTNELVDIILQKFNKIRIKYLGVPAESNQ